MRDQHAPPYSIGPHPTVLHHDDTEPSGGQVSSSFLNYPLGLLRKTPGSTRPLFTLFVLIKSSGISGPSRQPGERALGPMLVRRPDLRLEDDEFLEEDIGTASSPYFASSIPSASSLVSTASGASSSTTLPWSNSRNGSLSNINSPNPLAGAPRFIESLDSFPSNKGRGKLSSLNPNSPSTSSLPQSRSVQQIKRPSTQLSRSNTDPTRTSLSERKRVKKEQNGEKLQLDEDVVKKLRRWVTGIAVVEFDLDDGPTVSGVYPPMDLTEREEENIAFSAFPDSLQFDQGSQVHSFRMRKECAQGDGFLYGFSHFTQKRDPTSKRGYQQTSVVILTQFQYPALFSSLAAILGPLYQQHGLPMLESACYSVSSWSEPTPGTTLELGFIGTVLHTELPHSIDAQQLTETSSFNEKYDTRFHILATSAPFHPPPLLLFEACMANLWSIWECLLLCEPILIFGNSPAQTSQAVWWLRDLVRPIPMAGDFRPYLTMQDGDHSALINKLPPKPGLLIGVTNPFFEKSCNHWPHVLSLGRRVTTQPGHGSPVLGNSAGPVPGWRTRTHKRHISKDRALLKRLEAACRGNDHAKLAASLDLRRHFCSRTTQFITPLARYLNTLIPNPTEVKTARARGASNGTLRLKPFNTENFMDSLRKNGSPLPFKSTSKRTEFYERWLKSPAFGAWLVQQEGIVQAILNTP